MIATLARGYSSESTQWDLSKEYQHLFLILKEIIFYCIYKYIFVIVLYFNHRW